ncbi:uncharacterized protein LOC132283728 [Cornus florida]|uniref:uncharacterized protein LOC132283728 n=1 Tax=Cornus florida TaxID=4283 RepID=UPI0028969EEE|nr:uncharacterized protein LOC132283728 [Cornus florida]
MADEVQYASSPDSATNKRKYGDQTPPPPSSGTRRATRFSAPIASQSPDSGHEPSYGASYNSVPPPVDDFQMCAQEIAALGLEEEPNNIKDVSFYSSKSIELYNDEHGTNYKLVKIKEAYFVTVVCLFLFITFEATDEDKDGGQCKIFNAGILHGVLSEPKVKFCVLERTTSDSGQEHMFSNMAPSSIPVSYGEAGTSKKMDADPNSPTRIEPMGTPEPEQIAKAKQLINETLNEQIAETGGSGTVSPSLTGHQAGGEQFVIAPDNKGVLAIVQACEIMKNMPASRGVRIHLLQGLDEFDATKKTPADLLWKSVPVPEDLFEEGAPTPSDIFGKTPFWIRFS